MSLNPKKGTRSGPGRGSKEPNLILLQRRFALLSALRWLPTGLCIPVTVLIIQTRLVRSDRRRNPGHHGVAVAVLELPTGGLADTIGRRPVLLLSAALHVVAIVVWGTATRVQMFAVASVVLGAGRALSSGPL